MDDDELARRCADAMWAKDRASQALGMRIESVGPGRSTLTMPVTDVMLNGHDICHGGYIVLLADSAFAFACNTYNRVTVAQTLDVTFLAPVHAGDLLRAEAVERVRRGRSGIYDVAVTRTRAGDGGGDGGADGEKDELVAEFRGRSRTLAATIL